VFISSRPVGLLAALTLLVAGCGAGTPAIPSAATSPSGAPSASPSAQSSVSPGPAASASASPSLAAANVRLALDWTPNTDHTGIYVARGKGWYRDAAINLKILPYAQQTPETLIAAGQAECGISFQDSLTFAAAAGAPITSVMAILQKSASAIAVLASSSITRPRELDGKTYAGFGYPNEVPTLKFVIQHDGGKGTFRTVTLDSAAYEALYSHRADFTIPFTAWEGVEAQERGIALRYFGFTDYGFPDFYQVVLACDRRWLERAPDVARRFVSATAEGFQFAADQPDEAARLLISENPGVFDSNPKLPVDSQRYLAQGGYLVDASGRVGTQTLGQWQGYSGFLYQQHLLTDAAGKPLASPPDYASLFTNDFLPAP
jgi:ABC-type nitrate/sulfonate/bicarbonate transport system substrate-binding protein